MELLAALKFVKGIVRKNKVANELEHFRIKDGHISGYNGHLALSAPVDLDFEAYPQAEMFAKAAEACSNDATSLHMTGAGRLAVKSGGFKAYIPCLPEVNFSNAPAGELFDIPTGFASQAARLLPFIADDATRPWAMGLLIADGLMTATNNVILVQLWTGHTLPRLNIPKQALAVLAKVGVDPVRAQTDGNTLTFHYEDGRWLRTSVYADDWPLEKLQSILTAENHPEPLQEGFKAAVEAMAPFCPLKTEAVYFSDGEMANSQTTEVGVFIACEGLPDGPIFSIGQLTLLCDVVERIDWSMYPSPCIFFGQGLRGAVVGRNY